VIAAPGSIRPRPAPAESAEGPPIAVKRCRHVADTLRERERIPRSVEPFAAMTAVRHHARRPSPLAGLAFALALVAPLPALAVQVTQVRAGAHSGFTRVVFELDGAAGYRVEEIGTRTQPVLRVSLDAGSRFHRLRATGDVRDVKMTAGPRAVATIALARSGLRVQEMILSNPYRIVLDLHKPETALAKTSAPVKTAAKPAPETKPAAGAKPSPEPVAEAKPAPKPAVTPPAPVARTEPAPPGDAIAKVTPPKPAGAPKPAITPKPEASEPADAEPMPPAHPPISPGRSAQTPADAQAGQPPPPAESAPAPPVRRVPAAPSPTRTPSDTARAQPVAPAPPSPDALGWTERLGSPMWLGAIAAALIAFGVIVFAAIRRHRALPNDLDVTAIAEEIEAADHPSDEGFARRGATGAPAARPAATDAETSFAGLFDGDDDDEKHETAPAPERSTAASRPAPVAPGPRQGAARAAPEIDSLFDDTGGVVGDDASEGEAPMNQDMDLPADSHMGGPPPAMGGAAAPSPDVTRMLQEFERRIQTLEAKLDEANEAREKLERQVAAQSEELRVQRAAIARTQRALRTMSRADEDKATEPALREGDTQAKTRVNV